MQASVGEPLGEHLRRTDEGVAKIKDCIIRLVINLSAPAHLCAHSVRLPMFALTKIVIWLDNLAEFEFVLNVGLEYNALRKALSKHQ